jgi:LacI family transcriptional regulator
VLERLSDGATDGAIILLPLESSGELVALQESGFPFVVVDPRIRLDDGIPAVSAAHRAGRSWRRPSTSLPRDIVRIGHISGPAGWAATTERIEGYQSALAVAGVLPTSELIAEGNFEAPTGVAAANVLLDLGGSSDRDLRGERQHGSRRAPGGARTRVDGARRSVRWSGSTTQIWQRS